MRVIYAIPLLCLVIAIVFFAQANEVELSNKFMRSYAKGDFKKAANNIHCPNKYLPEMKEIERNKLAKEFLYMATENGPISSYKITKKKSEESFVFGCGTESDHGKIHLKHLDVFEISYENGKKGMINLSYVGNNSVLKLVSVGITDTSQKANSAERIKEIYMDLK